MKFKILKFKCLVHTYIWIKIFQINMHLIRLSSLVSDCQHCASISLLPFLPCMLSFVQNEGIFVEYYVLSCLWSMCLSLAASLFCVVCPLGWWVWNSVLYYIRMKYIALVEIHKDYLGIKIQNKTIIDECIQVIKSFLAAIIETNIDRVLEAAWEFTQPV